jgi:hypothetical protein
MSFPPPVSNTRIAFYDNNILIGNLATTGGVGGNSVVIGSDSSSGAESVSIGKAIIANLGTSGVTIGYGANNNNANNVVIGKDARGDGDNCVCIGKGTVAPSASTGHVVLGYGVDSTGFDSPSYDYAMFVNTALPATVTPSHSLTFNSTTGQIGRSALPSGSSGPWTAHQDAGGFFSLFNLLRLDFEETVGGTNQKILIGGTDTTNTGSGNSTSIAIGHGATVNDVDEIAIGQTALCKALRSVCIGSDALVDVSATECVAIGKGAKCYKPKATIIGYGATSIDVATGSVTAIGWAAACKANDSVAIGSASEVATGAGDSVVVGHLAKTEGTLSVAVGRHATIGSGVTQAVCVGAESTVNTGTTGCTVLGFGANASGDHATVLGNEAQAMATTTGQICIGYQANVGGDMTDNTIFVPTNIVDTTTPTHSLTFNSATGQIGRSALAGGGSSTWLQRVKTASGTNVQVSASIPLDATVPQNTEGTELTAINTTITPQSTSSKLRVTIEIPYVQSTTDLVTVALFRDSGASAVAAGWSDVGNAVGMVRFSFEVTSGSLSATTFKVRAGVSGATAVNIPVSLTAGVGTEYLGGIIKYSMTIDELM